MIGTTSCPACAKPLMTWKENSAGSLSATCANPACKCQAFVRTPAGATALRARLAPPKSRFPAGVDDAWFSLRWLQREADRLALDTARIAVAGDSAGATLAAVLAADAPESAPAQEANGSAAPEPLHGETSAPAGADTGPSLADCVAEARMWLDTLDTLAQSVNPNPAPRTTAALHAESTRAGIADALGGVLHYYGLTGAGIVAHPLGALALAMVPLLIPAWADFQAYRAAKAQQQAAKAPPPAPVSSGVADLVSTPLAPASNLHKLL